MNEIGYHGTCSKYRYNIEKNGLDPAKCKHRDDHWLGQGVYFFDDYEKALWWASSISSQNDNCGGIIFKSNIEAPDEEVLNLDDNKQLDAFMTETLKTLEEVKKLVLERCQYLRMLISELSFLITTTKRNYSERELQKKIMDIIGIKFQERQICVSKKECIKSTKLIYNEEEEVI